MKYRSRSSALVLALVTTSTTAWAQSIPGGSLAPESIPKYQAQMVIPPAMPRDALIPATGPDIHYYEIAVRQFEQQILPTPLPMTTVWSYGSVANPGTVAEGGTFFYPSFTIEARYERPLRVKWINDLVDEDGRYLPHLLPVDQTLHWANPPGPRDTRGFAPEPYTGPVPIVTHVHGAHTEEESDGYPEAWYLPDANDIPPDSPGPVRSTTSSRPPRRSGTSGVTASRSSSTETASVRRRSGTTTTRSA